MSLKNCYSSKENPAPDVHVNVSVDVPKIVKYWCIAGVIIVGIIFATKCFREMLNKGWIEFEEE